MSLRTRIAAFIVLTCGVTSMCFSSASAQIVSYGSSCPGGASCLSDKSPARSGQSSSTSGSDMQSRDFVLSSDSNKASAVNATSLQSKRNRNNVSQRKVCYWSFSSQGPMFLDSLSYSTTVYWAPTSNAATVSYISVTPAGSSCSPVTVV
jgi:hypothetical protein